ncbi:MAG: bifunctional riboflavin kinase/FAD synthetase [Bacteroidetes bacterium]|nr:bifunctional riboflavin kinase/FAD synthetase [Bacteroidota bacterium]
MEIISHIESFKLARSVATIGIFDGVHLAHQEIIKRIKKQSLELDCPSVLLTLWPHPRKILHPDKDIALLTTLEEKYERIEQTGIDYMVVLPFDKALANTQYQDFIRQYVYDAIHAEYILIGYNHHFGKNREGSYETLKALGDKFRFIAERLEPFHVQEWTVSSSLIRNTLWQGNIGVAQKMLGYPYFVEGMVVEGNKLGKKLGYPTANIRVNSPDKLIPAMGVYAVYVEILKSGLVYRGMLNIGKRPTISANQNDITMEVNLFDFEENVYDQSIRIHFIDRIREEKKFENLNALVEQLRLDKNVAQKMLTKAYPSGFYKQ